MKVIIDIGDGVQKVLPLDSFTGTETSGTPDSPEQETEGGLK